MTSVKDFKIFLRALINGSRQKSGKDSELTISEIKKDLLFYENIDVDKFVAENGHRNLLDLINEWEEFTVHYANREPTVRVKCGDHISKMNKFSKHKRGTINAVAKEYNYSQRLDVLLGPNLYGFSSESSINVFNDDIQYLNILNSNSNTSKSNDQDNQKTLKSEESMDLKNSRIDQVLYESEAPEPLNMMPTTSKAISTDSVAPLQVQHPLRQKLNILKNVSPKFPFEFVTTVDQLIPSCKTLDLKSGNITSIAMLDVVNPHRFWFAGYNEYKALTVLMNNMQEFYTVNQDSLRINVQDLQRGLYVAALYNGIWHRGMVVKKDGSFARISYVDFGTADDQRLVDLCYLKQDFLNFPCPARRGVMAFIQPKENDEWSDEAKSFFEQFLYNKKLEIKIFKHNSQDNSYYLGIKYKNEQKILELLANTMITRNFAEQDLTFLENGIVSKDSYGFNEYEKGILLDIKQKNSCEIDAFDSWLPFHSSKSPFQVTKNNGSTLSTPSTNNTSKERLTDKVFTTPKKVDSLAILSIIKDCEEVKQKLLNRFINDAKHDKRQIEITRDIIEEKGAREQSSQTLLQNEQNLSDAKLSSSLVPDQSAKECQSIIYKQSFEKLTIGKQIEILIHAFYDASCFFFYIKNEMAGIKKFLENLNDSSKECLKDDELILNREVAVFNDDNYCRGRINSIIQNEYQIFLIDFGVFIMSKRGEIYQLQREFTKRKPCIYKGCSMDVFPTTSSIKTFTVAKILGIRNENTVDLKIEAI